MKWWHLCASIQMYAFACVCVHSQAMNERVRCYCSQKKIKQMPLHLVVMWYCCCFTCRQQALVAASAVSIATVKQSVDMPLILFTYRGCNVVLVIFVLSRHLLIFFYIFICLLTLCLLYLN